MNPQEPRTRSLSTTNRIGLLGDTHSDLEHFFIVSKTMWARGVSTLAVLGDFGFIWPSDSGLDELNRRLAARGQKLYWVCGNPEPVSNLYEFPFGEDGLRWVRPQIAHVPRGYRTALSSGRTFAALNGSNAVAVGNRSEGHSSRLEKAFNDQSLEVHGQEYIDVLIGQVTATPSPALGAEPAQTNRLLLGRHYHQNRDEPFDYGAFGDPAEARIILLAMSDSTEAISQAILDLGTLKLDFFARTDTTVTELTGQEAGCWRVTTVGSSHILDLDRWTATRIPGKGAFATFNDRERPLIAIRTCRVGEGGFWTMDNDGWSDPNASYWHASSEIKRIQRIADPSASSGSASDGGTP